ncbi:MAG: pyrroline-5-carboxylate reductase [Erysipelotrichaceae bacterium]|nr:pyrroline-5-carboxylate reductase [Erysipelotrichaceae bacterium]
MKYGFIGIGNMGTAIIQGMRKGNYADATIYGYDTSEERKAFAEKELGLVICPAKELASNSDVIVLAVKPQYMQDVLQELQTISLKDKLFISIAAGLETSYFERNLPEARVVRVMPNLNAANGEAISAVCNGVTANGEDTEIAEKIFESVGETVRVSENLFAAFSAIAGASPAFVFEFADALAMAAVKAGIPRALAIRIANQAIKGSAVTLQNAGEHPDSLRDKVCSPGGTTIEGIAVLEKNSFKGIVMDAVEAVIEKDKKLGK